VLKEYPHLQWSSEKDRGMSDGINKGFLRAKGDWMMWLNADDYLLPGALARVAMHIEEHPEADVVYGDCEFVTESKELIRRKREHRFDFNVLLFYGCYIPSTSTFLRRSIIEAGHLVDVEYRVCMDFEYYLRLSWKGYRFSYLPSALAGFRWHGTNTSTQLSSRRYEERLKVQRYFLQQQQRSNLGGGRTLEMMRRIYQAKHVLLRAITRHV
jgi:GT2 family glycosyltransferase